MRAVAIRSHGGPEVIQVEDLPAPAPGVGEALVRVAMAGVGATDVAIRSGRYPWLPPLPTVLGIEASGVVERVGPDVDPALVGEHVVASAREWPSRSGCCAEVIAAPAESLYRLPEGADPRAAACLANYQVAWHLLEVAGSSARQGSALVTLGAAGGIGSAVVDLASARGIRVVAVVSTEERGAAARAMGAAEVVNRSSGPAPEQVAELLGGAHVDCVVDHVGGPGLAEWVSLLDHDGTAVLYGAVDGAPDGSLGEALVAGMGRSVGVRTFSMHTLDRQVRRRRSAMGLLVELMSEGRIRPLIDEVLPMSEAAAAHRRLAEGSVVGKLLLDPSR